MDQMTKTPAVAHGTTPRDQPQARVLQDARDERLRRELEVVKSVSARKPGKAA